jgi:predicted  nucleic acid-binding Zn-ribbon protein
MVQTERQRRWQPQDGRASGGTVSTAGEVAQLRRELDAAMRRAAMAEAKLEQIRAAEARLGALRRLLAREFHPDTAAPAQEPALQAAYAEIFKRLWPRIDAAFTGHAAATDRDGEVDETPSTPATGR